MDALVGGASGARSRFAPRLAWVGLVAVMAMVAGACTPPTEPAPDSGTGPLHVSLVDGGFELSWDPAPGHGALGYEVQRWTGEGPWELLATTTEPTFVFDSAVPMASYGFRVRAAVEQGATPKSFTKSVNALYVEPQLPVVRIDTDGYAPILDRENYVDAHMTIDPNGTSFEPYEGTLRIRGRGNSTWNYPKKPYRLKLDDGSEIMGMPSEKDWNLLANFVDRSQLRTWAAEQVSLNTSMAWTPRYRHVEVILNGAYVGVYQLSEKVEPDGDRVDIKELDEDDIAGDKVTGGYLLEIDDRLEENNEPGWRTPEQVPVVIKEPDPAQPEQRAYIKGFVEDFEEALFSEDYTDPVLGYRAFLDVESFIDYWIIQEVTRNGDSFWSSTYFWKERGEDELVFGPMWDHDRSMGSTVTVRPQPPEGWYARDRGKWTRQLFTDPAFVDQVQARWAELAPALSAIPAQLEVLGAQLAPAIANDEVRWGYSLADNDQPEFLSQWMSTRIQWMTDAFAAEP